MKKTITKVLAILTQKMVSTVVITLLTVVTITVVQAYLCTNLAPVKDEHIVNKAYLDARLGIVEGAGASTGTVIALSCAWRYDYREGAVGNGEATNWQCNPPACPTGYTSLGIGHEPTSVACSGSDYCDFDASNGNYHPVTVGRSVRLCEKSS